MRAVFAALLALATVSLVPYFDGLSSMPVMGVVR